MESEPDLTRESKVHRPGQGKIKVANTFIDPERLCPTNL